MPVKAWNCCLKTPGKEAGVSAKDAFKAFPANGFGAQTTKVTILQARWKSPSVRPPVAQPVIEMTVTLEAVYLA